ncbi:MAG: inorganic phosphate transporter [Burkholderiales bacterium]
MMILMFGLLCAALLAYANGANDNFKGVATLFGSGVSNYKKALNWATATTLLGSVAAIWLTAQLVEAFSGKLFVSAQTLALPGYPLAVVAAAAATVLIATRIGAPISTTHSLAGALLGAAFAAPESVINWARAGTQIFLPLGVGPGLAIVSAMLLYPILTRLRQWAGITRQTCVCVGEEWIPQANGAALGKISVVVENQQVCQERYTGAMFGFQAQKLLDGLHYLSAGMVSFARGVNDTPKIVALALMAAPFVGQGFGAFSGVGLVIAIGGLLSARRVAETMSQKITTMNPGQGLTANLITSSLVMAASPLGLPLSTTHVSCGALFGIGAVTRQAHWTTIAGIFAAWLITLPLAALLGASLMRAALILG